MTSETPASGAHQRCRLDGAHGDIQRGGAAGTISFTLQNSSGSPVAATVTYNSSNNTATLTPSAALANSTTYTATVSGARTARAIP